MSALYFTAGCLVTLAVMLQTQDKELPWWMLIIPAIFCLVIASAPGLKGG